jgi:ABC-type polysaccharide/polyol phosphate export permease
MGSLINLFKGALLQGAYMFQLELQNRYRRTFFGYFWFILPPIAQIIPMLLISQEFQTINDNAAPSSIIAIYSVALWLHFTDAINLPLRYLRRFRKLMKVMAINDLAIVGSAFCHSLINLAFLMPVILFIHYGASFPVLPHFLELLCFFPIFYLSGLVLSLIFINLSLVFFDFFYLIKFVMPLLFWITPVIYTPSQSGWLSRISKFNPLSYLFNSARGFIFDNGISEYQTALAILSLPVILFFVSLFLYRKSIRLASQYVI